MAVFKAPRITTAQREALLLEASEIVYDTDKSNFYGGNGTLIGGFPLGSGYFNSEKYIVEQIVLTTDDINNKNVKLLNAPIDPQYVTLTIKHGISQINGEDFIVTDDLLSWNGLGLDGFLEAGDVLIIEYSLIQQSGITIQTITLNSQHIANKYVTLLNAPVNPSSVTLDIKGGISQLFGEDFFVMGDMLTWNTLGLDGFLEVGDVLIIEF
jgi:hypothetical protein